MSLAYDVSAWNRRRKWNLFNGEISPTAGMHVLVAGFSQEEFSDTVNFIEKYYPYREILTALGIDTPIKFKKRYPKVATIQYDGGTFPFKDKTFDV